MYWLARPYGLWLKSPTEKKQRMKNPPLALRWSHVKTGVTTKPIKGERDRVDITFEILLLAPPWVRYPGLPGQDRSPRDSSILPFHRCLCLKSFSRFYSNHCDEKVAALNLFANYAARLLRKCGLIKDFHECLAAYVARLSAQVDSELLTTLQDLLLVQGFSCRDRFIQWRGLSLLYPRWPKLCCYGQHLGVK